MAAPVTNYDSQILADLLADSPYGPIRQALPARPPRLLVGDPDADALTRALIRPEPIRQMTNPVAHTPPLSSRRQQPSPKATTQMQRASEVGGQTLAQAQQNLERDQDYKILVEPAFQTPSTVVQLSLEPQLTQPVILNPQPSRVVMPLIPRQSTYVIKTTEENQAMNDKIEIFTRRLFSCAILALNITCIVFMAQSLQNNECDIQYKKDTYKWQDCTTMGGASIIFGVFSSIIEAIAICNEGGKERCAFLPSVYDFILIAPINLLFGFGGAPQKTFNFSIAGVRYARMIFTNPIIKLARATEKAVRSCCANWGAKRG